MVKRKKDLQEFRGTVGLRLRKARKEIHLTQREMAGKLDMDTTSITGIEIGKAFPSFPTLYNLWKIFRISAEWMIYGEGEMFVDGSNPKDTKIQDIYPDIPDDKNTQELLFWLQDDFVRHTLISEFLELKILKHPGYFVQKKKEEEMG
jgi:transcriptional regulator with XRE-family HTH domain